MHERCKCTFRGGYNGFIRNARCRKFWKGGDIRGDATVIFMSHDTQNLASLFLLDKAPEMLLVHPLDTAESRSWNEPPAR